jgi:hypothetical protein
VIDAVSRCSGAVTGCHTPAVNRTGGFLTCITPAWALPLSNMSPAVGILPPFTRTDLIHFVLSVVLRFGNRWVRKKQYSYGLKSAGFLNHSLIYLRRGSPRSLTWCFLVN